LRNATLIGKYLTHYSNELEELYGYELIEGRSVFFLEGHFGHLGHKIFFKKKKWDHFSTTFFIFPNHSREFHPSPSLAKIGPHHEPP
jgi:hypothetical protein